MPKRHFPTVYTGLLLSQDPNDLRYHGVHSENCRTVNDYVNWEDLNSEVTVKKYPPELVQKYLKGEAELT